MSCGPVTTTFRILDRDAGWTRDLLAAPLTDGALVDDVIELALDVAAAPGTVGAPRAIDAAAVDRRMFPPRLARGCGACDFYLATTGPGCRPGLWRLSGGQWRLIAGPRGCRTCLVRPTAIAAAGDRIAVRDEFTGDILVLTRGGQRVVQSAALPADQGWSAGGATPPTLPIALARTGVLWAVATDRQTVIGFDRAGVRVGELPAARAPIERLAVDRGGQVWIATAASSASTGAITSYLIERLTPGAAARWIAATAAELEAAFPDTGLAAHDHEVGFCLELPRGGAAPRTRCFDWCGRPLTAPLPPPPPLPRRTTGTVGFTPIDSGLPRCRWHRVRVDAELPPGTRLEIAVATLEDDGGAGVGAEPWAPDAVDWQVVDDALDFLIDRATGRYLHLRLRLHGRDGATPRVHRIRLDFPRSTSAEHLPGVYREPESDPAFLDHFLSLFDATLGDLDRAIERFPALLDPDGAPDEALPWLASLLDLSFDPAWRPERRRALLAALPELYRRRGTPEGLRRAVELATGVSPAIEELGAVPAFAGIGRARVGEVRLFGRGRVRTRLGASRLGQTRIDSYGDPDVDARRALAHRVRIQVPAREGFETPTGRARLERLVEAQKPAHVVAAIRVGGRVALVGASSAVGIDTRLATLPPPVLGAAGNVRLRRTSVLWPGPSRAGAVLSVDRSAAVGVHTILR